MGLLREVIFLKKRCLRVLVEMDLLSHGGEEAPTSGGVGGKERLLLGWMAESFCLIVVC